MSGRVVSPTPFLLQEGGVLRASFEWLPGGGEDAAGENIRRTKWRRMRRMSRNRTRSGRKRR
eukprot:8041954-Pyramimonas_sp.AAC.1